MKPAKFHKYCPHYAPHRRRTNTVAFTLPRVEMEKHNKIASAILKDGGQENCKWQR